jgi:hypothetical protein
MSNYVPSPNESDFISQDARLITFGKEQSHTSPRLLTAMGDKINREDSGPNGFTYVEAVLLSTAEVDFRSSDTPMTDEAFFQNVKGKPGLVYNVLSFNRKHNMRTFDFVLSYEQLNSWAAKAYKPVPVVKQFKGSLIFSGCSTIFNKDIGEQWPLALHTRYELIGDSLGEDDSLDGFGGTKGGPKIICTYTYDEDKVYFYIKNIFPYRVIPVGQGKFQDISIGDNSGTLTYETKPKRLTEADHVTGTREETPYERDAVTYCKVSLSLRDTTISHKDSGLEVIPFSSYMGTLAKNAKSFPIAPGRNDAVQTSGFTLASDVNTEVASDVHTVRFGNRALGTDKPAIEAIAQKIEEEIKDAAITVGKVPFIIKENIRFHGSYSAVQNYFIDNRADSFGRLYINEVGYYDAVLDKFSITNYFFDFENSSNLKTVKKINTFLSHVSPEHEEASDKGSIPASFKSAVPLELMKSFDFVDSGDYTKYNDIVFIQSKIGPVNKAFIELAKGEYENDFDKLIYFSYNPEDDIETPYDALKNPSVSICNFKDYNMDYVAKTPIPSEFSITIIARLEDDSSPYSYIYFIGTKQGVFYTMALDSSYKPVFEKYYHNPFIHNDKIAAENDWVIDNEAIEDIRVDSEYIYFIGKTKFALYSILDKRYIPINPEDYSIALGGKKLDLVKRLNENEIIFATTDGIAVYNIDARLFSSHQNNFKYNIDFYNNYASDSENINHNFDADDIVNAGIIQVGQDVYLIGSRKGDKTVSQVLNTKTGVITDLGGASFYTKPSLATDKKRIFAIGGKTTEELIATRYRSHDTPFRLYDTVKKTWGDETLFTLEVLHPSAAGQEGRLGYGIPFIAPNDDSVYIFHPELVVVTDINQSFYNNDGIKIVIDNQGTPHVSQFAITGSEADKLLVGPKPITWVPIRWTKDEAEFITLYRVEEETTFYRYVRFKVSYDGYNLEILENLSFTNTAFCQYADEYIITDAFSQAKVYNGLHETIIFCRDKFIFFIGSSGLPELYALWNNTELYPDCPSLMSELLFNRYWKKNGGNKTHLNTYLIDKGEYLVFAGGEGYKVSHYFDLTIKAFMYPPQYNVFDVEFNIADHILKAAVELTQIPSNFLTLGAMSSSLINGDIYIAASIVTDSLALSHYEGVTSESDIPLLLLFKIESSKKELVISLVRDLTSGVDKKGLIDGFKYISLYQMGRFILVSCGIRSYYNGTQFIHEHQNEWGNVVVYDPETDRIIYFANDDDHPGIGLFPLIFQYKERYAIICRDTVTTSQFPLSVNRSDYEVGFQYDNGKEVTQIEWWKSNGNRLHLASEAELPLKYASGTSYGNYGFIVTPLTLELVDLDKLMKVYQEYEDKTVSTKILYRFSAKDKAIFKDLYIEGNYLYITGGLKTSSFQNDSDNGLSNRMLKFYIPELLKAARQYEKLSDISRYASRYTPEVIQLASPSIKYFSAYGITKRHELITVGEVHFVRETNPEVPNEAFSFDALIAPKGYIYQNINKSFVKKQRIFPIDSVYDGSSNRYDYQFHAFTLNNRDFILLFNGKETPGGYISENVDLYDVNLHTWLTVAPLPAVLSELSINDHTIVGAMENREDGTMAPYNKTLTLVPTDSSMSSWEWEIEEFSNTDTSSNTQVFIKPNSAYARWYSMDGEVKTLLVAKNQDNSLAVDNNQIQLNVKSSESNRWYTLPNIPVLPEVHYKVLGCNIEKNRLNEHLLVLLYQPGTSSFHLWDYYNGVWNTLFTDLSPGEIVGMPNQYDVSFATDAGHSNQVMMKWKQGEELFIGRIKWEMNVDVLDKVSIDTLGSLSQFNDTSFDELSRTYYAMSSGNLYLKNNSNQLFLVPRDELSFVSALTSREKLDDVLTDTTFSEKILSYQNDTLEDAVDVKQLTVTYYNHKGIVAVYTKASKLDPMQKQFFLGLMSSEAEKGLICKSILLDEEVFQTNIEEDFELLPWPTACASCTFLLITRKEGVLTAFKIFKESENDDANYAIKPLFTIQKENEDSSFSSAFNNSRHAITSDGTKLYQLAKYPFENYTDLYQAPLDIEAIDQAGTLQTILMNPTNNPFANVEQAVNIDMAIVRDKEEDYLVILMDEYFGGVAGEYARRVNRLYSAPVSSISMVPHCLSPYEIPLAVGKVSLVNAHDDKGTVYLVPRTVKSKQPIIRCQIKNSKNIFTYHSAEYLELTHLSNFERFHSEKEFNTNWVVMDEYLYNLVYGVKMPLGIFAEKKLPRAYRVNKEEGIFVTFTTYGNYLYVVRSEKENNTLTYYLDTIDSTTLKLLAHKVITKGTSITGNVELPLKESLISISLEGDVLILTGGKMPDGEENASVFSIAIATAVVNKIFDSVLLGSYAPFYESPNDNAVYAFSQLDHTMVVIPYRSEDGSPVTIPYQDDVFVYKVLTRGAGDKLKVIGESLTYGNTLVIFDIDLFTGSIDNYLELGPCHSVAAVLNHRTKTIIYTHHEPEYGYIDIYEYDKLAHSVSLLASRVRNETFGNSLYIKTDGLYERDDFIALDTGGNCVEPGISQFILLKPIHPDYEEIERKEFPVVLGNQTRSSDVYNTGSPLVLTGRYEYFKFGEYSVRFDKAQERLEIMSEPHIYIECDDLLWSVPFYKGVLLSVYYREETILYYVNLSQGKIITSKKISDMPLLHRRKTAETAFVDNFTVTDGVFTTLGTVYVVGGESEQELFQDIQELQILLKEESNSQYTLTVYSSSIIPGDTMGAYKARIIKLSNKQVTVLFGYTYEYQAPALISASIPKSVSHLVPRVENEAIHYITPGDNTSSHTILTRYISTINNNSPAYKPKGFISELFILSNHFYFVIGKYRYAAEINEQKQLSNALQFGEFQTPEHELVPKYWDYIDEYNHFTKELNDDTNTITHYNSQSAFSNIFHYNLHAIPIQSEFDFYKRFGFYKDVNGQIQVTGTVPDEVRIISLESPSFHHEEGYVFDVLFQKIYKDLTYKTPDGSGGYVVHEIKRVNILSRVPATPYRLNTWRRKDAVFSDPDEQNGMVFTFQGGNHELVRDDGSYLNHTWKVVINNGEQENRCIKIILNREFIDGVPSEDTFIVKGDDPSFPFTHDLLPVVLTFGVLEGSITEYRYYLFMDIQGNIVTFDRKAKNFISIEGLEDVNVPYLSGELIILPSKVTEKGSVGRRVWGFSGDNPYTEGLLNDEVSIPDTDLV